jgi:hypothetical protein
MRGHAGGRESERLRPVQRGYVNEPFPEGFFTRKQTGPSFLPSAPVEQAFF